MPSKVTDLADSRRCQAIAFGCQCTLLAEEGSCYCSNHGNIKTAYEPRLKGYLLTGEGEAHRVAQLAESDTLRLLRESVALSHRSLERFYNLAETNTEYLSMAGQIDRLIKTSTSSIKLLVELEEKMSSMLSKETFIDFLRSVSQVILEELAGIPNFNEIVDRIGERISHIPLRNNPEKPAA